MRRTAARRRPVALLAALLASGCAQPMIEGGQVTQVPAGLAYDGNCSAARHVLPGRELVRQRCWYERRGDAPDWITVSEYRGTATRAEVEGARAASAGRYASTSYGELEPLSFGRHAGWAYTETQEVAGKTASRQVTAVVPWGASTFSVEFTSRRREEPELRRVVASFRVVSRRDVDPVKVALALLLGAAVALGVRKARGMRRERRPPLGRSGIGSSPPAPRPNRPGGGPHG